MNQILNSDRWEESLQEYAPDKFSAYMQFRRKVLNAFRSYQIPVIALSNASAIPLNGRARCRNQPKQCYSIREGGKRFGREPQRSKLPLRVSQGGRGFRFMFLFGWTISMRRRFFLQSAPQEVSS